MLLTVFFVNTLIDAELDAFNLVKYIGNEVDFDKVLDKSETNRGNNYIFADWK